MPLEQLPIGVIGLGLLGTAVAERLLSEDSAVVGFDLDAIRRDHLRGIGGSAANQISDLCSACDVIVLSLPNSQIVSSVIQRVASALRAGMTIIDTTTGDPEQMVAIGKSLAEQGVGYLEANVAGSSVQMREGTATVFLGGDPKLIEATQSVLSIIAPNRVSLGPVGCASKFKLVHNLILGLHRAVLAEGLCFAESLGFHPSEALAILQETPAASAVMATKGEKMATRNYHVQARLSQHLKDVGLILEMAKRAGSHTPLCEVHRELLERAESLGFGEADNSAIIEAYYSFGADAPDTSQ
jgi:3-hydroxyisobutyrate dehydrogenase-like beta-hydroxyacid dehydrogenase